MEHVYLSRNVFVTVVELVQIEKQVFQRYKTFEAEDGSILVPRALGDRGAVT